MSEAVKGVGYTDDGMVGVLIEIELGGQTVQANLAMDPEYTVEFSRHLLEAAKQAKVKRDEQDSQNPDKGGSSIH